MHGVLLPGPPVGAEPAGFGETTLISEWRATKAGGGFAFDGKLYMLNRSMIRGRRLSRWFANGIGSTQCQAIAHCDSADRTGVNNSIEGDCVTSCRRIAEEVAAKA